MNVFVEHDLAIDMPVRTAYGPRRAFHARAFFERYRKEVKRLVRWAQANPADYGYVVFFEKAKAAGCAGYFVSFSGRRVLYFGRTAETHIEHFPS